MADKNWCVRIEWARTTRRNIVTEVVAYAPDANVAIARAVLDAPRPSNVVGLCDPCSVTVEPSDEA